MRDNQMCFKVKIEKSIWGMFGIFPLIHGIVSAILNQLSLKEMLFVLIVSYLIISFLLMIMLSIRYIIEKDALVISILGKRRYIKYNEIKKIERCSGLWKIELPSGSQIKLLSDKKTLATVCPIELDKFEEEIKRKIHN